MWRHREFSMLMEMWQIDLLVILWFRLNCNKIHDGDSNKGLATLSWSKVFWVFWVKNVTLNWVQSPKRLNQNIKWMKQIFFLVPKRRFFIHIQKTAYPVGALNSCSSDYKSFAHRTDLRRLETILMPKRLPPKNSELLLTTVYEIITHHSMSR